MNTNDFHRVLSPLANRIKLMLMRGTLERVDDSGDLQNHQVSVLSEDVIDECERVGQYGLTSNPPRGSAVVLGAVGGHRSHVVILGVDDRSRPHPLPPGATCIYDSAGTQLYLSADGNLLVSCSGTVTIDAPEVHFTGNVTIDGTLNGMPI